jgi:hypothetical protein
VEAGGVEERDAAEVDHHASGLRSVELHEQPIELRAGTQIDVAVKHDPKRGRVPDQLD